MRYIDVNMSDDKLNHPFAYWEILQEDFVKNINQKMRFIILQQQKRQASTNSIMESSALYKHLINLLMINNPDIVVSAVYKG